MAYFGLLIRF